MSEPLPGLPPKPTYAPFFEDGVGLSRAQWKRRRWAFNGVILLSLVAAFFAYVLVVQVFKTTIGRPYVTAAGVPTGMNSVDVDDGPFGLIPCCCGPIFLIPVMNLFYLAGPAFQSVVTESVLRRWLGKQASAAWWLFAVACASPFWIVPLLHLAMVCFFPSAYDNSPIVLPR